MDLNSVDGIEQENTVVVKPIEVVSEIKDVVINNDPIPTEPLKISRDNFRILTEGFGLISSMSCMDCDLRNGFIRQPDNYGNLIIELDLTSILNNRSLSVSNAREKYLMMKALEIDDSVDWSKEDLLLVELDKSYTIMDKASSISFKKPVQSLMGNKFIDNKGLENRMDLNNKNMIFNLNIKPHMIKRVKSMCDSMGTDMITIEMKDTKADLCVNNKNNTDESTSKIIRDFDLDKKVPASNLSFTSTPFGVNPNVEMTMKLFKQSKDFGLCFEQKLFDSISFRLYTLVRIKNS